MAGYNPGGFKISNNKVKEIITLLNLDKDDIKSIKRNLKLVKSTLKSGDMQLAKVISLNPLQIACFSDEFDSVLIYEYPTDLINKYHLYENEYLVCSNSYWPKEFFSIESDIILGENASNKWRDVICFVPLFLCNEKQELFSRNIVSKIFTEKEFEHFEESIIKYLEKMPNVKRFGFKTLIKY